MTTLLVPTDFTNVSRSALKHALKSAEHSEGEVILLHVCKKLADVETQKTKMNIEIEEFTKSNPQVKFQPIVRMGSIYETIAKVAIENAADMIYMGTHGASGWQKIVGSNALKVIGSTDSPFIIVQGNGIHESGYKNIIVPVSLNDQSKQKAQAVADLAKKFNSTVHMIYQQPSDSGFKSKVSGNLKFMKKYFKEAGVSNIKYKSADPGPFNQATLDYVREVNGDLIAIMNMQKDKIMGSSIFGQKYEQELITNKLKVPVLVINPRQLSKLSGGILWSDGQ